MPGTGMSCMPGRSSPLVAASVFAPRVAEVDVDALHGIRRAEHAGKPLDIQRGDLDIIRRQVGGGVSGFHLALGQNQDLIGNINAKIVDVRVQGGQLAQKAALPWSKNAGSNKHRLTHPRQLLQYRALMPEGSEIYFKTDDDDLFRDSLGYFPAAGFEITWQTFDLHKNEPDWNLRTEHEGMFSEQGIPIKALIARKGPDSSVTWVEPKELARRLEPEEEADPAGEVQE